MSSVIRFFSLALALAVLGISAVDAYAIPRASVDYRRHDVNVRIIEETRSIPSVASSPRYLALRREVRDFRVPSRLRTRQTLPRPPSGLADTPDIVPVFPLEEHGVTSSSSTVSTSDKVAPRDVTLPYTDAVPTLLPRDGAGLIQLDLLNTYYQDMRRHSRNLRMWLHSAHILLLIDDLSLGDYRRRARDSRNDPRFREDAGRELRGFRDNMDQTQGLLGDLGRDKGLANYDRNNGLETLLKDIVNLNKDTLSCVTDIVYEVPLLGSTLGPSKCPQISAGVHTDLSPGTPVVGELKCIVDEVLNTAENAADGLLNSLGVTGQWEGLRRDYVSAVCGGGLQILGLCVDANLSLGLRADEGQ